MSDLNKDASEYLNFLTTKGGFKPVHVEHADTRGGSANLASSNFERMKRYEVEAERAKNYHFEDLIGDLETEGLVETVKQSHDRIASMTFDLYVLACGQRFYYGLGKKDAVMWTYDKKLAQKMPFEPAKLLRSQLDVEGFNTNIVVAE